MKEKLNMGKIDNYYLDIIKKIDILTGKNLLTDALKMLEEELQTSYVPQPYFGQLQQRYILIANENEAAKIQLQNSKMTKLQILTKVYENGGFNSDTFNFLLSKYHNELDNLDFQIINRIFKSKTVLNSDKIFCLTQLKLIGVKYEFEFYNNNTKQKFIISPTSEFELNTNSYFKILIQKLYDLSFKEPSINTMENDVAKMIYDFFFISLPEFEPKILANIIHLYVSELFKNEKLLENSQKIWIDNIIKKF